MCLLIPISYTGALMLEGVREIPFFIWRVVEWSDGVVFYTWVSYMIYVGDVRLLKQIYIQPFNFEGIKGR